MKSRVRTNVVDRRELVEPPYGRVIRAGVIPYFYLDGQRHFLLGLRPDYIWTDVGGGCKTSRKETPMRCLHRETDEEIDETTGDLIKKALDDPTSKMVVWRQTANRFSDYGLPFVERKDQGPIFRYFVFLELKDPLKKLGGPTGKEEVTSYRWLSEQQLRSIDPTLISDSIHPFLASIGLSRK
jgi:hypothetical protein